jgi:hypothetical protein
VATEPAPLAWCGMQQVKIALLALTENTAYYDRSFPCEIRIFSTYAI